MDANENTSPSETSKRREYSRDNNDQFPRRGGGYRDNRGGGFRGNRGGGGGGGFRRHGTASNDWNRDREANRENSGSNEGTNNEAQDRPPRREHNKEEDSGPLKSRRLFVGNLSYHTSWQKLKDTFRQCGNVEYADVMRDRNGNSKGCGIIEFETIEQAEEARKTLNDTDLDGRTIFIREDRENHARKVYVGNLSFQCRWGNLKDEFNKAGKVGHAEILLTPDGRSRGQGVVSFENEEDVAKAVEMFNGKVFMDREITVRPWQV